MATTMNFFQAKEEARGATGAQITLLVLLFMASFVVLTYLLYYVIHLYLIFKEHVHAEGLDSGALILAVMAVLLIMGGGSLMRWSSLDGGGAALAARLGGRLVDAQTISVDERKYLNVVEEMALASGMPVPSCYVIPGDNTINAFAAGSTVKDAVICITQGSLVRLTRDELQGVVAHEFSHIGNGDMKLNMQVICALAGLTTIGAFGLVMMKISTPSDTEDFDLGRLVAALIFAAIGAAMLAIGSVGAFFARIIQAAVAYQREYLADASSVQFTRNPLALASALKKASVLAGAKRTGRLSDMESQHLFFVSSGGADELFSAHPPILQRIKRIDPTFDGVMPTVKSNAELEAENVAERGWESFPSDLGSAAAESKAQLVAAAAAMASSRMVPTSTQVQSAFGFTGILPDDLRAAAATPVGAMGLVLGLILRQDAGLRAEQLKQAQGLADGEVVKEALKLEAALRALPPGYRVPLLDLSMPALRQLSPAQILEFSEAINQVGCHADDGLVVLLIHASMLRYLSVAPKRMGKVGDLQASCALVLSAVVQTSSEGPDAQAAAYLKGANVLGMKHLSLVMIPAEQVDLAEVESALGVLTDKSVIDLQRRKLVYACWTAMLSDAKSEPAEIEIVRAVADSLGVTLTSA